MLEKDIEHWIIEKFPEKARAIKCLSPVLDINTAISRARIIRSILYLSESDYDSLAKYANEAAQDPRNVLWWAEYNNREEQVRDFNKSLYEQT